MRVTIIPFDFVRLGHHPLLKVTGLLSLYSVYKGGSFTVYIFACFLVPYSPFWATNYTSQWDFTPTARLG